MQLSGLLTDLMRIWNLWGSTQSASSDTKFSLTLHVSVHEWPGVPQMSLVPACLALGLCGTRPLWLECSPHCKVRHCPPAAPPRGNPFLNLTRGSPAADLQGFLCNQSQHFLDVCLVGNSWGTGGRLPSLGAQKHLVLPPLSA